MAQQALNLMDVDTVINMNRAHELQGESVVDLEEDLAFDAVSKNKEHIARESFAKSLKIQELCLRFEDIRYEVDVKSGKFQEAKQILKGISGEVKSGELLCCMGASGAGKTSLLNMLAGRLSDSGNGRSSGAISINGHGRDFETFRHLSAYVLQSDNFFAELTVKETLMLSASLRLPSTMSYEEKSERVEAIISELGLRKVEDTYVGNDLIRGVSGGERKRVNIGVELVTNPSLIFLDEPTTGLDSFNAQNVMQTLLELAQSGRTVVATIHQPRSSIYGMFDKLLLLSEGMTMYYGPAAEALGYFEQIGYECPSGFNPADYFLDLISLDQRSAASTQTTSDRIKSLQEHYKQHEETHTLSPVKAGIKPATEFRGAKYATSWLYQFKLLTMRSIRLMMREKATNIAEFAQTIVFGLLLGSIWLNAGNKLHDGAVQSVSGAYFFLVVNQAFGGVFGIIFLFPAERVIVLKERAARTYHVGAYFWSKTFSALPRRFVLTLMFALLTYFMVGFRSGLIHLAIYVLVVFSVQLASEGLAYIVSAMAKDPQQAGAIAPVFIVTSMLFGGFFVGVDAIPVFLAWLKYVSFIHYGFAALMQNEFGGRVLEDCTHAQADTVCFGTGKAVLSFYELDSRPMYLNIFILLGMIVVFRFLAYVILRRNGPKYDHSL